MKTKVIRIGNSKGVRIPKSIIDQSGLTDEVELELKDDSIIIKPISSSRENWDNLFKKSLKTMMMCFLTQNYYPIKQPGKKKNGSGKWTILGLKFI